MREFLISVAVCLLFAASAAAQDHTALRDYGRLPLVFESNHGQADPAVKFLARAEGGTLFLTEREAVIVSRGAEPVRMRLVHAGKPQTVQGLEPTGGISNYFIGNDPTQWRTGIPHYSRVEYKDVYAGVDMVYYGNPQKLEYDLVVAPGADAAAIQVEYEGVESLRVDRNGDLVLKRAGGELRQKCPRAYQETASGRVEVKVGYRLKPGRRVAFELAQYDAGRRLVIDPVLLYSTYLGGSGDDVGQGIAVDGSGSVYITGTTSSTNFPTTNPLQASNGGFNNVFVTKVNAAGSARVYSTYLGGNANDVGYGIAVDGSGNAYVTGATTSTDFPTMNPLQSSNGGFMDAIIVKLNANGSGLVYATYLGGTSGDYGTSIAVDGIGNAYVTGETTSTNFPTTNPLQSSFGGGGSDAFVTKINLNGSARVYSTYLGGSTANSRGTRDELAYGIAVDSTGAVYLTGSTSSVNFPTMNPFQPTYGGGSKDVFVTKINASGSALVYSTFLGGAGTEEGYAIAVDGSGSSYVTGYTTSPDFPTTNPLQFINFGGNGDAFVTKINPGGSARVYSTYLGGSGDDRSFGVAVDGGGNAYITGYTASNNFPIANSLQATKAASSDVFVAKINANCSALLYSTFLGGLAPEGGAGIAVDVSGNAYVTGSTGSPDFPTANPLQSVGSGNNDLFLLSISSNSAAIISPVRVIPGRGSGATQIFTFTFVDPNGSSDFSVLDILINNALDGRQACYVAYVPSGPGSGSVLLVDDAGDAGGPYSGMVLPGRGTAQNNQCTISGADSSVSASGNSLTLTLAVTFAPGFVGNKVFYLAARSNTQNSGWHALGTWEVPGPAPAGPGVVGAVPGRSAATAQTYAFTFTDTSGFEDLAILNVLINNALDGRQACYLAYVPSSSTAGTLLLVNDAGSAGGPFQALAIPSSGTINNSQCTISGTGSSVSAIGNTMTLNLAITFSSGFAGDRVFYLAARNNTTGNSGWQAVGSVTALP